MTKISKIISIITAILVFTGTILKTYHWPGANIILVTGATAGILLFILIALSIPAELRENLGKYSITIACITLIIAFLAFTFKLLHWPGAGKLIWIGDIAIIISTVVFLVDAILEKDKSRSILKIIIAFFTLFLFLIVMFAK